MKKVVLLALCIFASAFADTKLDFQVSLPKYECTLIKWIANDYESGVEWKYYAKIACVDNRRKPVNIAGLKLLDSSVNLKGEYIYTYGWAK